MAQYQSFPDAPGDSRTLDKLKSLKLPDLAGRRFLDVGCNEGFFCGFARYLKASRSVGIDHSRLFIERARKRFPHCEFLLQGWDHIPEGPFDVILLASALHYADDQPALLHRLVQRLSPGGVLVLEVGIVSAPENAWVEVERGIDKRHFPTMAKLREVLSGYAWKWMGKSVSQDGDPVARHVIHISQRLPVAYLLMQPPAYGKTSIASGLFAPVGIPVISGDEQIGRIAKSKQPSGALGEIIKRNYSPFHIDQTIRGVFEAGMGPALVDAWLAGAGGGDIALDAYVPFEYHALVEATIGDRGYLPVLLRWERVGPTLLSDDVLAELAESYCREMASQEEATRASPPGQRTIVAGGYVDQLSIDEGLLRIRGWAIAADGSRPSSLAIRIGERSIMLDNLVAQSRPDVQSHMKLPHPDVGFAASLSIPGVSGLGDLGRTFVVSMPSVGPLRFTRKVATLLENETKVDAPHE